MWRVSEGDTLRYPQPQGPGERRGRFEALYAVNFGAILGYAVRRTGNGEDAADVVAETFLVAWRRLDDVPAGDDARLWLYGVARRVLANHHRGERRQSGLSERLRGELALVHRDPEYTGELAAIAAAFRGLPEPDRELLALVAWEGLGHAEIAVVLGCSQNAVRIRVHRARAKFASAMAGQPGATRSIPAWATNGDRA